MNLFDKYEGRLSTLQPEVKKKVLEYAKEFYQQGYTRFQAIEEGIHKVERIYRKYTN